MTRICWTIFLLSVVFLASSAWAEPIPVTINYQSYLSDANGGPLPDGTYELTFRLYNASQGGSALWTETWAGGNGVPLTNGRYSVDLGSLSPFGDAGLDFSQRYYLEIQVGADAPFAPRLGFNAVPYALHAANMAGTPLPAGDVVGTSDVQTLSGKTLTSPVIDGGTIDNAVIGATTPAAGAFTTLTATGDLVVTGTITGRTAIEGTAKIADYTLTATDDLILVDTSSGAVTITLPQASGNSGRTYGIKLKTAGNPLTVATTGLETIDGLADLTLESEGQAVRLVSDGSNWQAVSEVNNAVRRDTSDLDQDSGQTATADQVLATDLIVQGSNCIGLDCGGGEDFGFDTLRLKENNLRIHFQDTSTSASFPTNDWRIAINDNTVGGRDYFAIEDVDHGKTGLVVEAGGNVGIGTSGAPQGRLDVRTDHSSATGTVTVNQVSGTGTGTISSIGTTVIGSGSAFLTELVAGAQVTAGGETRTVISISSNTILTVDAAWSSDLSAGTAFDYDYPGNSLTGTGTAFTTELSVGDNIFTAGVSKQITAITSDTALEVDSNYSTVLTDVSFAYKRGVGEAKIGILVTADGKIGIGTATPGEKFEIEFAPGVDVQIGRGVNDPDVTFIALRSPNGTRYYVTVNDAGDLVASAQKP